MATNAKQPAKWPQMANGCRVEAQFLAKSIIDLTREAQVAVDEGKITEAIIILGDARDAANAIVWKMVQAGAGIYDEAAATQDQILRRSQTD